MSLIAIKQYMSQVKMASLESLCAVFKVDVVMMRCLLHHWIRKGRIKQCLRKPACGTKCFKCQVVSTELYEWLDGTEISA